MTSHFGNLARHSASLATASLTNVSTLSSPSLFTSTITQQTSVSANSGEIGLDLKPGALLSDDLLLYRRIGVAFNRLNIATNTISTRSDIETTTFASASQSKNVTGLRLGIGMEHKITKYLSLTGDYIYTDYGSISTRAGGVNSSMDGTTIAVVGNTVSGSLRSHAIMIGLTYHFA